MRRSFVKGVRGHGLLSEIKAPAPVMLKDTLRKLFMRIHPDLLQQYPAEASINEANFQKLMEFMTLIKEGDIPKKQILPLEFYLRTDEAGIFDYSKLTIKTSGGICHKLVGRQLSSFFKEIGLNAEFEWGNDYWSFDKNTQDAQNWTPEQREELKRREQREALRNKDFLRSGALYQSMKQDLTEKEKEAVEQIEKEIKDRNGREFNKEELWGNHIDFSGRWGHNFIKNDEGISGDICVVEDLDVLAKSIAFVPFATAKVESEKEIVHQVLNVVLPGLEVRGWNGITALVQRIWTGERDCNYMCFNNVAFSNPSSKAFLDRVFHHTAMYENGHHENSKREIIM